MVKIREIMVQKEVLSWAKASESNFWGLATGQAQFFDALILIPMLSPRIGGIAVGIPNFNPGNDYAYAMYLAASLMAGWVFLLIWADRKPVER